MTAIEYIKTKERLINTTYIRRNGKGYRLIDGELIPEAEFQAANKLPVRLHLCKENPCNKSKYLDV